MYLGRWYQSVAPTVEPISLAELKAHLRLGSNAFADNFATTISIASASYAAASSQTGTAVDRLGKETLVNVVMGAIAAATALTVTVQESEDNATWSTYGAAHSYTTADANTVSEIAYTGTARYVRAIGAVANDTAVYGVVIQTNADVATTDEDTYLSTLITTARTQVEEITWRALCTQTWVNTLDDGFPACGEIWLPRPPLQSVTSIAYVDANGAAQTLAATEYTVLTTEIPGRVVEAYEVSWPSTRITHNAVTITYVAGYGLAATVPTPIKQAILMLAGHLYENREAVGTGFEMPMGVDWLLKPYMVGPRR